MKKIILLLLLLAPSLLTAQWSIVPSGSVGMSDFKLDYMDISDFTPHVGFTGDVTLRYSIPYSYFYVAGGVGFLNYKSNNDAILPEGGELAPGYISHAYLDERVSALYIPLTAGFYLPDQKLSPIIEAGAILNLVLDTGDFTEAGGYDKKSNMFSFMVGAGARYKLYKENALEVKFRYTQSTNMLNLSGSHWNFFSLNVGYAISL